MANSHPDHISVPHELCQRLGDIRYVCEASGWSDLVYLLDLVAHELKARLTTPPDVQVEVCDVAINQVQ